MLWPELRWKRIASGWNASYSAKPVSWVQMICELQRDWFTRGNRTRFRRDPVREAAILVRLARDARRPNAPRLMKSKRSCYATPRPSAAAGVRARPVIPLGTELNGPSHVTVAHRASVQITTQVQSAIESAKGKFVIEPPLAIGQSADQRTAAEAVRQSLAAGIRGSMLLTAMLALAGALIAALTINPNPGSTRVRAGKTGRNSLREIRAIV
jgi:hypothetical protein